MTAFHPRQTQATESSVLQAASYDMICRLFPIVDADKRTRTGGAAKPVVTVNILNIGDVADERP